MERTACFEILSNDQKLLTRDENGYIFTKTSLKNGNRQERIKTIKDIDRLTQDVYKYNADIALRITHPHAPHITTLIPAFLMGQYHLYRTYFLKEGMENSLYPAYKQDKKTNLTTLEKRVLKRICPKRYPHHSVNTKNPPKNANINTFVNDDAYSHFQISSTNREKEPFGQENFQNVSTALTLYLNPEKTKTLYIPNEEFRLNSRSVSRKISNMRNETEHAKLTMLDYILPHIERIKQTLKKRSDMLIAEANQRD